MKMAKRIFLFLAVNFLVLTTITLLLSIFHVQPYLQHYGIHYQSLLLFCLVWGMGGALISLLLSKSMAKWMMGVRIITEDTSDPALRSLLQTVQELARAAGMAHIPEVGIYESAEPNAFATGPSQRRSLVAVSTGLLRKMNSSEIEGVLAHELSHITNGDMVTMTLIQGVVNAFVMFLARALAFALAQGGKNKNDSSSVSYGSYTLWVFLLQFIFMILGSLVVAAFSRHREYRADRGGAFLAGKEKMIASLEALQKMQGIQDPKHAVAAFQSLKISTAKKTGWLQLFASHPALSDRIERLRSE